MELLSDVPDWATPCLDRAADAGARIEPALEIAVDLGARLPNPGDGRTLERWAVLAALARRNVTVARVVEAHTDALSILAEAGIRTEEDDTRAWGVFAAEGAATPLTATDTATGTRLTGDKPWCSLGAVLDAALVTAHVADDRALFAVDLHDSGVHAEPAAGWVARGLPTVTSCALRFTDVPARAIGATGWYLARPGFAWGGLGVAACWYGAAEGVADQLRALQDRGRYRDDVSLMHRGRIEAALHAAACTLGDAADRVDHGRAPAEAGAQLALVVRSVVADAAELVLREVGHACGPAPLAFDEQHAARVADLEIYLRQHHGERDLAELGRASVPSAARE